jgi:hypothetical protein
LTSSKATIYIIFIILAICSIIMYLTISNRITFAPSYDENDASTSMNIDNVSLVKEDDHTLLSFFVFNNADVQRNVSYQYRCSDPKGNQTIAIGEGEFTIGANESIFITSQPMNIGGSYEIEQASLPLVTIEITEDGNLIGYWFGQFHLK